MPAYDSSRFNPPGPLALVTLRVIQTGKTVSNVPMLIDSGSDVTLIPEGFIAQLGLNLESNRRVELGGLMAV